MLTPDELPRRLEAIQQRIHRAAQKSGRDGSAVTLVCVSKGQSAAAIRLAHAAGQRHFGENYLQEAAQKRAQLQDLAISWHAIGALQSNKVKQLATDFTWFHGFCTASQAKELVKLGMRCPQLLVQVNVAAEPSKSGLLSHALRPFLESLPRELKVVGLMAIPPVTPSPEGARSYFQALRELAQRVESWGVSNVAMQHLSMGMSHDFEVAIEEGATMVRIGSAIFGARA